MILSIFTTGYGPEDDIVLIGVRSHTGEKRFFSRIVEFVNYFLGTDDKIVVGFNILKWDIPFLLLKAQQLENFKEFFRKVNYSNIVDLFTILTFHNRGIIKGLDFHLQKEGIAKDFLGDVEIGRLAPERSMEEAGKKLEALNTLYWRMKK